MTKDEEPKITSSARDDFTRVTFKPDLAKFKMTELDDDIIALMCRRAYDIAGSLRGVKVFLNNKQIPVSYQLFFLIEGNSNGNQALVIKYLLEQ